MTRMLVIMSAIALVGSTTTGRGDAPPRDRGNRTAVARVNVKEYGAKGDGVTDDTAAIQSALDAGAGKDVDVPSGRYVISADGWRDGGSGGLAVRSNTRLHLAPDAVLQAKTTNSSDYVVIRLERVSNVVVQGGTVRGERATHTGTGGEWGYGIGIFGASKVTIQDLTVRDCWGDGIFIEEATPGVSVRSTNITIRNVVSTNNRRQGMSVVGVDGLRVVSSVFERTNGTAPEAGVDIEPGGWGHTVRDVVFENCTFRDNSGRGLVVDSIGTETSNVKVIGGATTGNWWEGIAIYRQTGGTLIAGVKVTRNGTWGIWLSNAANVAIRANEVSGNSQKQPAGYDGIYAETSSGIAIAENVVRAGSGARAHRYGISLNKVTNATVTGNDLAGSGRSGEIHNYKPTGTTIGSNRLDWDRTPVVTPVMLGYGSSVAIDVLRGQQFVLSVTDRNPFTMAGPTNGTAGQRIRIQIRNLARVPLGPVTWSADYSMSGWANPAAGSSHTIEFVFDGRMWIETARTTDVRDP